MEDVALYQSLTRNHGEALQQNWSINFLLILILIFFPRLTFGLV